MTERGTAPASTGAATSERPGGGLDERGSTTARRRSRRTSDAVAQLVADSLHMAWLLSAESAIAELAWARPAFTADDVHELVGSPPGHGNAVGGPFISAARRG